MKVDIYHNTEGYVDPTAFEAIKKVIKAEKEQKTMDIFRGDIFSYDAQNGTNRMALVLTPAEKQGNKFVSIIVLIDEAKSMACVPIVTTQGVMYADCGLISFTKRENLTTYVKTATDSEMDKVTDMVAAMLGIEARLIPAPEPTTKPATTEELKATEKELFVCKAERDVYKELYFRMLDTVCGQKG